jgi:ribosomal protein S18 acetylase RimI-like enzyme
MADDVTVRVSHPGDVGAIQRVARAAWHAAYDDILGEDLVDTVLEEWYADEAIEGGITHDAQDFFVAVRDEEVLGYAHVGPHPPRRIHQVYRLYVHPDEWRQGIGRQLLAEVEQALYDRDVQRYEAQVLADNEIGIAFYEANGFERVERSEREMAGETVTEYVFGKRI